MDATAVKQQMSEKLPCVTDDEPKSYTPYIKYTKLEFKVRTNYFLFPSKFFFTFVLQYRRESLAHDKFVPL